ncbi:MAG: nucleotide exchange factor GrpE [bacterium]|nr:nucleotide exchange factor GrpE [bacterium]
MSKDKKKHSKKEEINIDETSDEIILLGNRIKELEEKLVRNQAELQNYKRRREEETSRIMKYANEDLILDILPILDTFERAVMMDDDNLEDEVSKFLEGFIMIYNNLKNVLIKFEVKEIEALNEEFDPTYHQAVVTEKKEDTPSGMVIEVMQKGYIYKDKVIRPVMVKVSE